MTMEVSWRPVPISYPTMAILWQPHGSLTAGPWNHGSFMESDGTKQSHGVPRQFTVILRQFHGSPTALNGSTMAEP